MKNYNAGMIVFMYGGRKIDGLDGTFVKVSRKAPVFSSKVGVDGKLIRSQSLDKSGTVEVTVQATSAANDYLSGLLAVDEATGINVKPLEVKDKNGLSLHAGLGWISGWTDVEYAAEGGAYTWKFEVDNLAMFVGGALL